MRTTTERPVRSLVTRSCVPNGRVLCAAVRAFVLNRSPFAVRRPWKPGPYQEAAPLWTCAPDPAVFACGLASATPAPQVAAARTRAATLKAVRDPIILSSLVVSECGGDCRDVRR